jgi:hypothetical protein
LIDLIGLWAPFSPLLLSVLGWIQLEKQKARPSVEELTYKELERVSAGKRAGKMGAQGVACF